MAAATDQADRLQGLPPELLTSIVELIPRPEDLKALCMTSKTMQNAATPLLYHNVVLDENTPGWPMQPASGFLSAGNPGLGHVRRLEIACDSENTHHAARVLHMTMQLLPRDTLRELDVVLVPLDEMIFVAVFSQQKRLRVLCLGHFTFDPMPLLKSPLFTENAWTSLEHLMVPRNLQTWRDLQAHQYILERAKQLKKLWTGGSENLGGNSPAGSTSDDVVLPALFSQMGQGSDKKLLELEEFRACEQSVECASKPLTTVIDFGKLTTLSLCRCEGWESMLSSLTKQLQKTGSLLRNVSFKLKGTHKHLSDFLCSFRGLRSIRIGALDDEVHTFDTSSIDHHSATLEYFYLGVGGMCHCEGDDRLDQLVLAALNSLVKCPHIVEAAVPLPAFSNRDVLSSASSAIEQILRLTESLKRMSLLYFTTWPAASYGLFAESGEADDEDVRLVKLNQAAYMHEVDNFMSSVFRALAMTMKPHQIPVLAFSKEWSHACDGEVHERVGGCCYFAVEQKDIFGRPIIVPTRMSQKEARYICPYNDMF